MNNDLKEQDLAYSGDPMFDDILKDLLALNISTTAEVDVVAGAASAHVNCVDANGESHSDSSSSSDNSNSSIKQ
jgi:hypothetical protein